MVEPFPSSLGLAAHRATSAGDRKPQGGLAPTRLRSYCHQGLGRAAGKWPLGRTTSPRGCVSHAWVRPAGWGGQGAFVSDPSGDGRGSRVYCLVRNTSVGPLPWAWARCQAAVHPDLWQEWVRWTLCSQAPRNPPPRASLSGRGSPMGRGRSRSASLLAGCGPPEHWGRNASTGL